MLGELRCEPGGPSTSPLGTAKSPMCLTAFVSSSDARTAIATRQEDGMQPHPQPAHKEGPFLPGFKSAGLPALFFVDEIVLALMYLTLHDSFRAWKGFDW